MNITYGAELRECIKVNVRKRRIILNNKIKGNKLYIFQLIGIRQ